MRVKCLAQEHNIMTRRGLEPGPFDPESSVLTTRPPRFPQGAWEIKYYRLSHDVVTGNALPYKA